MASKDYISITHVASEAQESDGLICSAFDERADVKEDTQTKASTCRGSGLKLCILWIFSLVGAMYTGMKLNDKAGSAVTVVPKDCTFIGNSFNSSVSKDHPSTYVDKIISKAIAEDYCAGRRVFVQKLPPVFNFKLCEMIYKEDAINLWDYTCPQTEAFTGTRERLKIDELPASMFSFKDFVYDSSQFDLNSIINYRLERSECRVYSRADADLVYNQIFLEPLAAAYLRKPSTTHDASVEIRSLFHYLYHVMRTGKVVWPNPVHDIKTDIEAMEKNLLAILQLPDSEEWNRCKGCDQIVVNSRIPHDFHHFTHLVGGAQRLFREEEWKNVNFISIEGFTKEEMNMFPYFNGVPYPGHIHPSNLQELRNLESIVRERKRKHTISIIGKRRRARAPLMNTCDKLPDSDCIAMTCSGPNSPCKTHGAITLLEIMVESKFCYEPHGDSPTRQGYFDAISVGCIPVVPDNTSVVGYMKYHLPQPEKFTLFAPNIKDALLQIEQMGESGYQKMFNNLIQVLPRIVYAREDVPFDDASQYY
eukprot:CAMPEP_0204868084 /NCGR_PEP_ID=MMETSP1348-20121228/25506_1 /ASSEMBLY_ACC=CAM_ASM_000700 /TAXON_ID=215587 /ORGANISM="Aplanochytrium stocchinoi, Strain GSBS06" /LENGTH=533 /DNA_ID=CAMNT_0052020879 /DNA_START=39 /DNA_END=1641 /DNA_ORIENTATION=+